MRVLITGSNSLLGKALWGSAPQSVSLTLTHQPDQNFSHPTFSSQSLDVTSASSVTHLIKKLNPEVIIHLAAESNVDFCQSHPELAFKVNVNGTQNIINTAKITGAKVLFTSSNGIFDGKKAPYNEQHKPNPIHVYGKTKYQGEKLVRRSQTPYLITRLITMYGWPPPGARQNPVTWALEKLQKGETLNMVNDSFINPLYAPQAAEAIWKLIDTKTQGIYHIAGATRVSRHALTVEIAKIFGFDPSSIRPVSSSFFPSLTPRPKDTTFSTTKIQKTTGWKPLSLKKGLSKMRKEM